MSALGILWFVLIAVLICGYFVLDGMDLGVGVLYFFLGKTERDKDLMLRAIGPVWDANEVWLLTAGGALFAAFAPAYATSFSGFYLAIMLVLFSLIVRAIGVEFAHRGEKPRGLFDAFFFVGSLVPALVFGVAVGNVIGSLPLDARGDYTGGFVDLLLNPFALLCGIVGLVHMLVQGASWLALKLPKGSELQVRCAGLRRALAISELVAFALATVLFVAFVSPFSAAGIGLTAPGIAFAVVYVASTAAVIGTGGKNAASDAPALLSAGVGCAGLVGIMAATLFPNIIPARAAELSITVANAASSDLTLTVMTIIACIGVPLVLAYHVILYRTYRGRLS